MGTKSAWNGTTFGSSRMHEWLIAALKFMDVRLLYAFSAIFVIPVTMMINHRNTGCIYRYFHERIGFGRLKSVWQTYVNHVLFGQVVIDKFAMFAGKLFQVTVEGYEHYARLADKGYVQLSSHIGNYEMAGYTLKATHKRLHALVFEGEKATVMLNRQKIFQETNVHMIAVKPDGSHIFELNEALVNHEIVSMPADRQLGSGKTIRLPFLGKPADFPMGPFAVATMREQEVLAVNVMKSSLKGYTIYITPLLCDQTASRKEQCSQLAQAYVSNLETILSKYPNQWYNYFDFWK